MGIVSAQQQPTPRRIRMLQVILLILVSIISYGALILPVALRPAALPLRAGEVSPKDFQSPLLIEAQIAMNLHAPARNQLANLGPGAGRQEMLEPGGQRLTR